MPGGDQTLVGERGLSLSGGQKAGVNLARAVYRNADLYLLDDPLSAVDTKVGKHIFETCIRRHLTGKTRLLVTHQLQFLKQVDRIIVLQRGVVTACGSYKELEDLVDFMSLLEKKEKPKPAATISLPSTQSQNLTTRRSIRRRKISMLSELSREMELSQASIGDGDMDIMGADDTAGMEEEERLKGAVGLDVYRQYLKAVRSPLVIILFVFFTLISKTLYILVDWWLASWATWYVEDYPKLYNVSVAENGFVPSESLENIYVYIAIVIALFLAASIETSTFVLSTRIAARNLHDDMFRIVMRAPLAFFERNPVGRILNRFARDMVFMDETMPGTANMVIMNLMMSIAIVIFVCCVNFWALLFTIPMVIVMIGLRQYATHTTRDVKRIEALNRSPVYSHVTATLQGMPIIRAFGMEDLMIKQFDQLQDKHTASWLAFLCSYRWLGFHSDIIFGIYVAVIVFISLLISDQLDGTLVGLSMTYIFSMLTVLQFVVRQSAEVESYMTSVERILQYRNLEQEAPANIDGMLLPNWPSQGRITFDHMTVTYSEDCPPALNDICLAIDGGEKVGIVGRTGAGKTSLIAALMRLVEPTGYIWIDGVDVTTIGLDDLRSNISIIPQDPVLFTGTLRVNLDPFAEYNDEQIWQAIEEVQLKETIDEFPGKLYGEVAESGTNFSVGEKQLVCLARALLRQNKILLIDEATANVDQRTDSLIQATIRKKFRNCTVLTVAHRLNTIMDSEQVLVLDQGGVEQFDHPFILLQKESGLFYDMVQQTGAKQALHPRRIAQEKYNQASHHQSESVPEPCGPSTAPTLDDDQLSGTDVDGTTKEVSVSADGTTVDDRVAI